MVLFVSRSRDHGAGAAWGAGRGEAAREKSPNSRSSICLQPRAARETLLLIVPRDAGRAGNALVGMAGEGRKQQRAALPTGQGAEGFLNSRMTMPLSWRCACDSVLEMASFSSTVGRSRRRPEMNSLRWMGTASREVGPGRNDLRPASDRTTVCCTRSSARTKSRVSDSA